MMDPERYRDQLLARQAELRSRLGRIERHLCEEADPDWEEQATEREGDEVLEDLGEAGQAELAMIAAALDRIAAGSFGVCVNCGEDISEARLEIVPHAARCRACA